MMTFWNKAYLHYYGYHSVWHVLDRKLAKQRKSHIRGMIRALGIRRWRRYRNIKNKKPVHTCPAATASQIRKALKIDNWKNYGVNIKVKYG